jgi:hypothetical protein
MHGSRRASVGSLCCSGRNRRWIRQGDGGEPRATRTCDYIKQYKAENHLGAVTVKAMRAEPQPYWRGRVSENMMYHPDIVTEKSYTVCWQGVVSTYVCTSGAQVCW